MFFTANSETLEPIDYDRALIRAISVSAMLAGVSAIAIPAALNASISLASGFATVVAAMVMVMLIGPLCLRAYRQAARAFL